MSENVKPIRLLIISFVLFAELVRAAQCDTWVMWVAFNVGVHTIWVLLLLGCQMYQVRLFPFCSKCC